MQMSHEDLVAALWRAVGLTLRDLARKRGSWARKEEQRVIAVAQKVEEMLDPGLLSVSAQLHAMLSKAPE